MPLMPRYEDLKHKKDFLELQKEVITEKLKSYIVNEIKREGGEIKKKIDIGEFDYEEVFEEYFLYRCMFFQKQCSELIDCLMNNLILSSTKIDYNYFTFLFHTKYVFFAMQNRIVSSGPSILVDVNINNGEILFINENERHRNYDSNHEKCVNGVNKNNNMINTINSNSNTIIINDINNIGNTVDKFNTIIRDNISNVESINNKATDNLSNVETINNKATDNLSNVESINNKATDNISNVETINNKATDNISNVESINNKTTDNLSNVETINNKTTDNLSNVETINNKATDNLIEDINNTTTNLNRVEPNETKDVNIRTQCRSQSSNIHIMQCEPQNIKVRIDSKSYQFIKKINEGLLKENLFKLPDENQKKGDDSLVLKFPTMNSPHPRNTNVEKKIGKDVFTNDQFLGTTNFHRREFTTIEKYFKRPFKVTIDTKSLERYVTSSKIDIILERLARISTMTTERLLYFSSYGYRRKYEMNVLLSVEEINDYSQEIKFKVDTFLNKIPINSRIPILNIIMNLAPGIIQSLDFREYEKLPYYYLVIWGKNIR